MLCELFFCHEGNYIVTFESTEALNSHMVSGKYTYPSITSSMDKVKMTLAGRLLDGASAHSHVVTSTPSTSPIFIVTYHFIRVHCFKGWALPVQSKFRFSEDQKKYLVQVFKERKLVLKPAQKKFIKR